MAIKSDTTYRTKQVVDLSEADYKDCWDNNLWSVQNLHGSMRPTLEDLRKKDWPEEGWATILRHKATHELVGWCLTFRSAGRKHFGRILPGEWCCYFYVPDKHRRKGYGSKLHRIVRKKFGDDVKVVPWDTRSREFFQYVGAVSREDEW